MCDPTTLADMINVTSSPESEAGASQRGLPDGPTTAPCGQAPVPASPSASRARGLEPQTSATCGPSSSASFALDDLPSSWVSRLRQRLENHGSTECVLTWKASATPAGRPLFRLVPSMRPTVAIDFGLWPTPQAMDGNKGSLPPRPHDTGVSLPQRVASLWPTPTARDHKSPLASAETHERNSRPLSETVGAALGLVPSGSSEQTEKPGALNPEFVSWLMGFPAEWLNCAPSAMRSYRKSRPK